MVYLEMLKSLSKLTQVYDNFLNYPEKESDCVELWWGNPSVWQWSRKSKYKIGYALSESESLQREGREKAIENLKKCDLLICPSEYSTRAYKETPTDLLIKIVPLGYNSEIFSYVDRSWKGSLKVLLAGAAQMRKGTDLGIDGFIRAFGKRKRFQLTVWSPVKTPMLTQLKEEYKSIENIIFDEKQYENPVGVYSRHHVLLHSHLSEGFGLIPLEAMATGMSVLMSRVSSPMDYFNKNVGYWIEMSENYVPVRACLKDTNGFWRMPSIDSIAGNLKFIARHRDEAKAKGRLASEYVKQYTWENTAKKLIQLIQGEFNVDIGYGSSSL